MSARVFVAVRPALHAVEDLVDFLEPRAGMPWTSPGQWHLTLGFAATMPEHRLDDLAERLTSLAASTDPFPLRLRGGGCFPDALAARVLWLGVVGGESDLPRLAEGSRNALAVVGAPPDGRRFVPHLTLARPRRAVSAARWLRVLDTYEGPWWDVEEIELVESVLGQRAGNRALPRGRCRSAGRVGPQIDVEVSRRWRFLRHPSERPRRARRYPADRLRPP